MSLPWLTVVLISVGCFPSKVHEEDRLADPPLGRVRVYGNEVAIEPAAGTDWRTLVDLSLFGTLRPRMSLVEAKKAAGMPDREEASRRGTEYIYLQTGTRVVLAFEEHGSTFGSSRGWYLRAYPAGLRIEDLLAPSIARELERVGTAREVVLMKDAASPVLRANVADGLVVSVEWISE